MRCQRKLKNKFVTGNWAQGAVRKVIDNHMAICLNKWKMTICVNVFLTSRIWDDAFWPIYKKPIPATVNLADDSILIGEEISTAALG
jgi:hypothetical protein